MREERVFAVGVFSALSSNGKRRIWRAYTLWYNPEWEGCCEHKIKTISGKQAKEIAIFQCKHQCNQLGQEAAEARREGRESGTISEKTSRY